MRQAPVSPSSQTPAKTKKRKSKSRPTGQRQTAAPLEADAAAPAVEGLPQAQVTTVAATAPAVALPPVLADMDCPTCSRRLPGWAKFCRACGASQAATRAVIAQEPNSQPEQTAVALASPLGTSPTEDQGDAAALAEASGAHQGSASLEQPEPAQVTVELAPASDATEVPDASVPAAPPDDAPVLTSEASPAQPDDVQLVPLFAAVESATAQEPDPAPVAPVDSKARAATVDDMACNACEGRIPLHARFCLHCGAPQTADALAGLGHAPQPVAAQPAAPAPLPAPEPEPAPEAPAPAMAAPAQVFTSMAAVHTHAAFSFPAAPTPVEPAPSSDAVMLERFHKVLVTNASVRQKIDKLMSRPRT